MIIIADYCQFDDALLKARKWSIRLTVGTFLGSWRRKDYLKLGKRERTDRVDP